MKGVFQLIQINWENEQAKVTLPAELPEWLQRISQTIAELESLEAGEVGLMFVDDQGIRELNAEYRNIDRPTDVLSFAINEEHEDELPITYDELYDEQEGEALPNLFGDIVISAERAQMQADEYGHALLRELCFLYVHGFLHLLGYDHMTDEDEQRMIAKQNLVLAKVGLNR